MSQLETLLAHVGATAKLLEQENVKLRKTLHEQNGRLCDALDGIAELKAQIAAKDQIIVELQELQGRKTK